MEKHHRVRKLWGNMFLNSIQTAWNIGFIDFNPESILKQEKLGIRWMKHQYKDRWFADPFILSVTEQEIVVLVEEFYYPSNRGRIARLAIDRKSLELKSSDCLLELDSHLSFPAIFRRDGEVYVYPENSRAGTCILYKYQPESLSLEQVGVLCKEPLTDAVMVQEFGENWLFGTSLPEPNGKQLGIYMADSWRGPYVLNDIVEFDDCTARGAGDIFQVGEMWVRPAQDCNGAYGKGVVLQKVEFKKGRFSFQEIRRFYPESSEWKEGMHTFNVYGNITVIDGKKYRYPIRAKVLMGLNRLRKKL